MLHRCARPLIPAAIALRPARSFAAARKTHFLLLLAATFHLQVGRGQHCDATTCAASSMVASNAALEGLEPANVWGWFGSLAELPRPSKHEQRVQSFLRDFAKARGLEAKSDAAGNMVISRLGSGGGEAAPTVIIQGHIDMVTEKNAGTKHDFMSDPIRLIRQGDWLKADGTTLGADNGLGVAAALAVLDSPADAKLPPVEALFTVEEEIGLRGAFALDPSLLSGKTLLNLDTEEAGEIYVGCAGGGDSELRLPVEREEAPRGAARLRIAVGGLKGGHSGLNIADGRGNANQLVARAVAAVLAAQPEVRLLTLSGGDKRNALAREAVAILAVAPDSIPVAEKVIAAQRDAFWAEYGALEDQLSVLCSQESAEGASTGALTPDSAFKLLSVLLALPHGVEKWSHAVDDLVETSNNLAAVADEDSSFQIVLTTRSSLKGSLDAQRDRIRRIGRLGGTEVTQNDAYPGWAPNPKSAIVQLTKEVFTEVNNHEPNLKAIHAGLECGIIGERCPGIDMVSYGPTITGAHSPAEQVQISTVPAFWKATQRILERLADVTA